MSICKNLAGQKKRIFTSQDVTQSSNIGDNASFITSGNILSGGSIVAVQGKYTDLFAKSFSCTNAFFLRGIR